MIAPGDPARGLQLIDARDVSAFVLDQAEAEASGICNVVPDGPSTTMGQLIGSYATVTDRGGQMKLLNLQKRVHDLMQITKLLTVFETYTNEEAALRSFAKKK